MAYAIFRIEKQKTWGQIAGSASHAQRTRETPNADPNQENTWLIGNPKQDLVQAVRLRIGEQTIRKNAVLCVDMLLAASPEYFRHDSVAEAGVYEDDSLEAWVKLNQQWLSERFGDRVVSAVLHLDEATPHIQAHLVPIDEKGKLNCNGIFGSPKILRKWQDDYADAMQPLGLERGIRGSKATHIDIQQYYSNINSDHTQDMDVLLDKARDRDRAERQRREMEATAKAAQAEADRLRQQNQRLQLQIRKLKKQLAQQSEQLQDIPLEDVAYELGLSDDKDLENRWVGAGIVLEINGTKFSDSGTQTDGEGAIELVQHVMDYDYRSSVAWLADRFGETKAIAATTAKSQRQAEDIIATYTVPQFEPPAPDEDKWLLLRHHLVETCGLRENLVDKTHSVGRIYADAQGNAVFLQQAMDCTDGQLRRDRVTGASLLGANFNGLALGSSRESGWFGVGLGQGDVQRIALVESPIEVLSIVSLYPNPKVPTLYLATNGTDALPMELMHSSMERGGEIFVAYGAGESGEKLAQQVMEQLPEATRVKPQQGETWNEQLRISQQQVQEQPNRQAQQKQKSIGGGGMEL
jgi:hypothetical protein